jgi:hypothetical protein
VLKRGHGVQKTRFLPLPAISKPLLTVSQPLITIFQTILNHFYASFSNLLHVNILKINLVNKTNWLFNIKIELIMGCHPEALEG